MQQPMDIRIGCAGWSIPKAHADRFPVQGSHLVRYAARFPAVEIDSSFYRLHRETTYSRWAEAVPETFRFAVKLSREITHAGRLADPATLDRFLVGPRQLGKKLGPLLVQLPPSLAYDPGIAHAFFAFLRDHFDGDVVCEPRHLSWFRPEVERVLVEFGVARVAADPAPVAGGAEPGGWDGLSYYRLHGSPRKYYSAYSADFLDDLATKLVAAARSAPVWCIFDNTAAGAATANGLDLLERLRQRRDG
jgi:uncharacterized protein YecE (DUF72 family)